MNLNYDQSVNYLENFFYPLNRTRPHYTQVNSPYYDYVVENGTTTFFSLDGRTSFTEPTIPEKIYVIDHNAIPTAIKDAWSSWMLLSILS